MKMRTHGTRVVLIGCVLLLLLSWLMTPALARAGDSDADAGLRAYAEGRYEEAVASFEADIAHNGYAAARLYNLGNAYLAAGHPGRAILSYERAALLSPRDEDLERNLASARRRAGVPAPERSGLENVLRWIDIDEWLVVCIAALALLVLLVLPRDWRLLGRTLSWLGPRRERVGLALIVLALVASVLGVSHHASWRDQAVVVAPDAHLLISPTDHADTEADVQEGRLVRIERVHGDYSQVQLDDGARGWIPTRAIERITG